MGFEVFGFGELDANEILLLLGVRQVAKCIEEDFLDFLIELSLRNFGDTGLKLFIQGGLDIYLIKNFFSWLPVVIPRTGKKHISTVYYQVPAHKKVFFVHLITDCLDHPLSEGQNN